MAARPKQSPRLVAATTFVTEVDGREVFVRKGDVLASHDPLVKGRESLFEPASE